MIPFPSKRGDKICDTAPTPVPEAAAKAMHKECAPPWVIIPAQAQPENCLTWDINLCFHVRFTPVPSMPSGRVKLTSVSAMSGERETAVSFMLIKKNSLKVFSQTKPPRREKGDYPRLCEKLAGLAHHKAWRE